MGDVQATHHDLQPATEHAGSGFGIDGDIELCGRRKVAAPCRAAHQHQLADGECALRIMGKQQRDVGQRANGHQRHRLRTGHQPIAYRLERRRCQRLSLMIDKVVSRQTGLAVHRRGIAQRAQQRRRRPLGQRNVGIPELQQL